MREAGDMIRKGKFAILLVLVLIFSVVAAGCLGGGGGEGTTTSQASEGGQTSSGGAGGSGGTTSSSGGYSTTESPGGTGTTTPSETSTEYASWANPWDAYNPVEIDGQSYLISYIKYYLRIRKEEGAPIYEYEVEKKRGQAKIHVYGMKINMETGEQEKADLGEFDVYEYYGKITPVKSEGLDQPFEFKVWVKQRTEESDMFFLFPTLEFATLYYNIYGGSENAIGVWIKYGDQEFAFYNPAAVGEMSVTPYQEGSLDVLSSIPDIEDLYIGWYALYYFGFWGALEEENLYTSTKDSWGAMGYQYNYEIEPDGTIELGGKSFRVSTVRWNYSLGGATGQGEATITANLPIPIETKGVFISQQEGVNVFMHIKIEDMAFEKV